MERRIRRGKEVVIPEEWRGKVVHSQTIRKRPSKSLHKLRKWMKHGERKRVDSTDFDWHHEVDEWLGMKED